MEKSERKERENKRTTQVIKDRESLRPELYSVKFCEEKKGRRRKGRKGVLRLSFLEVLISPIF